MDEFIEYDSEGVSIAIVNYIKKVIAHISPEATVESFTTYDKDTGEVRAVLYLGHSVDLQEVVDVFDKYFGYRQYEIVSGEQHIWDLTIKKCEGYWEQYIKTEYNRLELKQAWIKPKHIIIIKAALYILCIGFFILLSVGSLEEALELQHEYEEAYEIEEKSKVPGLFFILSAICLKILKYPLN